MAGSGRILHVLPESAGAPSTAPVDQHPLNPHELSSEGTDMKLGTRPLPASSQSGWMNMPKAIEARCNSLVHISSNAVHSIPGRALMHDGRIVRFGHFFRRCPAHRLICKRQDQRAESALMRSGRHAFIHRYFHVHCGTVPGRIIRKATPHLFPQVASGKKSGSRSPHIFSAAHLLPG